MAFVATVRPRSESGETDARMWAQNKQRIADTKERIRAMREQALRTGNQR